MHTYRMPESVFGKKYLIRLEIIYRLNSMLLYTNLAIYFTASITNILMV